METNSFNKKFKKYEMKITNVTRGHVFSIKIVKKVKCHFPCFFIVVTFLIDLAFINFYIYFIFILLYNEFSFLHIYVIIIKYLNIYSKYK